MGKKGKNKATAAPTATENLPKVDQVVEQKQEVKKEIAPAVIEVKEKPVEKSVAEVLPEKNGANVDQETLKSDKKGNSNNKTSKEKYFEENLMF